MSLRLGFFGQPEDSLHRPRETGEAVAASVGVLVLAGPVVFEAAGPGTGVAWLSANCFS